MVDKDCYFNFLYTKVTNPGFRYAQIRGHLTDARDIDNKGQT